MFRMNWLHSFASILLLVTALPAAQPAHGQTSPQVCDVDADHDIDKVDIRLISDARGQAASGPTDPRDPDRDLKITAADARTCTLRCTFANCASPTNRAPIANAGPDQSVFTGVPVTLDGSKSTDPDGDPLTYTWTVTRKPTGSLIALTGAGAVSPNFTPDKDGEYEFQLVVNDLQVNSAPDTVVITTSNARPVANAGPDREVIVGTLVRLDGSASSDINGDPLTFSWSVDARPTGSSAGLSSSTAVMPTFTPDLAGLYRFRLVVNDGKLASLPDLVEIRTGALPNTAPIANAGLDQAVDLGATVQLDGSASSDPDHGPGPLTYSWSLLTRPAGSVAVISNATAIKPTFTADKAGEYVAQLIVNDSAASSSPDTVRISTRNTKPVANAGNDQSGAVGVTVNLDGRGSFDADGDPLSYQWSFTSRPAGSVASIGNSLLPQSNFIPDKPGLYVVQLVVDDGQVASDPDTATITIIVPVVPGLTINDVNIVEGNSGTKTLTFTVTAAPVPTAQATVNFATASGTATGGSDFIAASGQLTFAAGVATRTIAVTINGDTTVEPDETFNVNLTAPTGATITDAQGVGTITNDDTAALPTITITATDPNAAEAGQDPGAMRITRSGGNNTLALTVFVTVTGSTAANVTDYTGVNVGASAVIPAGAAFVDLTFTPVDDALVEGNETIVRTIGANAAYIVGTPNSATVTIADNDLATVTVVATDASASETASSTGTFTISRTGPTTAALLVVGNFSGTAANGSDYGPNPANVNIPIGQSSVTVTITPIDDTADESDETVIYTIQAGTYIIGAQNSATVTIADNDTATLPTVTLAATDTAASETTPNPGRFTFTRTGPTTSPLTVVFSVGGSATSGSDFTSVGTSVTIATGQATALVDINPIDDSVVEAPETVVLQIAANAAYTIGAPSSGTVTIADNDVGALVQFVFPTLDIGQNLQVTERARIAAGNAPAGGLALRIASSSPNVLLSATPTGAGAQNLDVTILANTAESPTFYVYALASSGTASLTIEILTTPNPGFSPGTPAAVTMASAGYELLCQQIGCTTTANGHGISTTAQAAPTLLYIQAQRLNSSTVTNRAGTQNVRGGTTISLPLSLSNTSLGVFRAWNPNGGIPGAVITTLSIPAGEYYTYFFFDPTDPSSGSGTIAFTKPAGAGTPLNNSVAYAQSMPVAVAGSTLINFGSPTATIGRDLQLQNYLVLGAPAPAGGLNLRLTSDSANAILSSSPTAAGAQTLDITVAAGTTQSPLFYVQSLASSGTANVTVQVLTTPNPGFSGGTPYVVTLAPSGFQLFCYSGPGTCTFDSAANRDALTTINSNPNKLMYIEAYLLNPANAANNIVNTQNVRGGFSVTMALSLTNAGVGELRDYPNAANVITQITIPGGIYYAYFYFDPNNSSTGASAVLNYTKPATAGTPTAGGTPRRQSMAITVTQ